MKKLLVLILTLAMILSVGYVTLASTIGIGATEGFQAEVGTYAAPSDYDDNVYLTGYYGLNEKTLFSLGYATDSKDMTLGARYAFAENMAVTLDYLIPDAEDADNVATIGFRYKANISDALALVGVLEYTDYDPEAQIDLIGQVEYAFTDMVIGTFQFDHYEIDEVDGTDITVGIEANLTEKLCVYLDYTIPDEGDDDLVYLGVCYAF